MHVLEFLNSYPGETFIQEHARAITKNGQTKLSWAFWHVGYETRLKAPVDGLMECVGLFNANRVGGLRKACARVSQLGSADPYNAVLLRQVNKINPDIIHFHFATLAIQHFELCKKLSIPFTLSIRGADISTYPLTIPNYVNKIRAVCEAAAGIHVVSEHLKDLLTSYWRESDKIRIIRTVINDAWKGVIRKPVQRKIVTVGRLHWRKGLSDLLLACALLKNLTAFELVIVGDGEHRQLLEYMIKDLQLDDSVTLLGRRSHAEIREVLSEADLFILPSIHEGFPNVVAEAMFARVPVVASRQSMVHELFIPDRHFIMVEAANATSIAEGIRKYFSRSVEEVEEMTRAALAIAEKAFKAKDHSDAFLSLWKDAKVPRLGLELSHR